MADESSSKSSKSDKDNGEQEASPMRSAKDIEKSLQEDVERTQKEAQGGQ